MTKLKLFDLRKAAPAASLWLQTPPTCLRRACSICILPAYSFQLLEYQMECRPTQGWCVPLAWCAETNFPAGINLGQRPTPHSQPPICTLVAEALVYNTCGNRIVPTNLPQCDSLQAIYISCSAQEEGSHWDGKHLRSVPKKRHFLLCFLTFSERLPDSDTSKLYNGSRVSLSYAWVL